MQSVIREWFSSTVQHKTLKYNCHERTFSQWDWRLPGIPCLIVGLVCPRSWCCPFSATGFCRQIDLTNVVAFQQQGKVHLFRVKNPTTKQAEVLALSPRQINDSIWMSDRGWQTSHTRCP